MTGILYRSGFGAVFFGILTGQKGKLTLDSVFLYRYQKFFYTILDKSYKKLFTNL